MLSSWSTIVTSFVDRTYKQVGITYVNTARFQIRIYNRKVIKAGISLHAPAYQYRTAFNTASASVAFSATKGHWKTWHGKILQFIEFTETLSEHYR